MDVAYDLEAVAAVVSRRRIASGPRTLARYAALLPALVDGSSSNVGATPLLRLDDLSTELGIDLHAKLETANPDGVVQGPDGSARRRGRRRFRARHRLLHVDRRARTRRRARGDGTRPRGDRARARRNRGAARALGAHVVEVDGTRSECRDLERELSALFPWGFLGGNLRPYGAEGPKTTSFEIAEQLGWQAPDVVVCPVASGALLAKMAQGFHELRAVRLLSGGSPRLVGAQAGFTPVAAAFAADGNFGARRSGFEELALGAARTSGGAIVPVASEDVRAWTNVLSKATGVAVDESGGAALGALVGALRSGRVRAGERVVLVVSGGLAEKGPREVDVPAVASELEAVLASLGVA